MMSTQPSVFDSFLSLSLSTLRLDSELLRERGFSQLERLMTDFVNVGVMGELLLPKVDAPKPFPLRVVMLPIRNRGTRVCIFCSSVFTRARISDTIWTPLLLDAVLTVVVVLAVDGARAIVERLGVGLVDGE